MPNNKTVLIIEDSKELVFLYQTVLTPLGCRLVTCADGRSAFEYLSSNIPDVIITDLTLPDMATDEFCERYFGVPNISKVPVILISGRDDLSSWQDLFNASYALKKPADIVQFRNCVKGLINQAQPLDL